MATGLDVRPIDAEISAVVRTLQTSWADFRIYCKAKIFECAINGGVASYTIAGRTVVRDLSWWQSTLELADRQAANEAGGMIEIPISFRARR